MGDTSLVENMQQCMNTGSNPDTHLPTVALSFIFSGKNLKNQANKIASKRGFS